MRAVQKRCQIRGRLLRFLDFLEEQQFERHPPQFPVRVHRLPNDEAAHPGGINGNDGGEINVDVLTLDVNASAHSLELHDRRDLAVAKEARHLEHLSLIHI